MLEYLCALLAVVYAIYWWIHRDIWIHGQSFPGPRWWPFVGNLYLGRRDLVTNFKNMTEGVRIYGDAFRLWMGPFHLYVIITNPEDCKRVLGNPNIVDHDFVLTKGLNFCNNLVVLNGEDWRKRRKLLTPTFNRQILHTFIETFGSKAQQLTIKLNELDDGAKIDIYRYLAMCTMDGVTETIIGAKGTALEKGYCVIIDCINRLNKILYNMMRYPWLLITSLFLKTKEGKNALQVFQDLYDISEKVIQERLADYRQGVRRPGVVTASDKRINSFLDVMIESSETNESAMTNDELRDEVILTLLAGTESSSLTLSYLLVLLAIHTDVQEEVYEELESIFGDSERKVTLEDMGNMPVLDRVIKESLRLFPVFPYTPRSIPEDVQLYSGKILPKGCSVLIFNYCLHRNEAVYKDANTFWPDRWLPENMPEDFNPYGYVPFSGGTRKCIGSYYAQLQMKATLGEFIRKFRVTTHLTVKDLSDNIMLGFTLQVDPSVGGFSVEIRKRERMQSSHGQCCQ